MQRESVYSSNLRSVGYDPDERVLEVEFHSGSVYRYAHVPKALYAGLMAARSAGAYFTDHIKDRYPTWRVR